MNIGVIFAGGSGKRMHTTGVPKQFLEINGKPIIIYTIEAFEKCDEIQGIAVVCLEEYIDYLKKLLERYAIRKVKKIVPGGDTGQASIYKGLLAAREIGGEEEAVVLVHDGVRPLIDEKTLVDNVASVLQYGSAITVSPAIETVIQIDGEEKIKEVIDRSRCFHARAPQSFYLKDILKAHEMAEQDGISFIDSATMMCHYGHALHTVEGPDENIKITTPSDFYICRGFLEEKEHSRIFGI